MGSSCNCCCRADRSDELVNACVQALDYQISVLYDLLQHYTSEASGGPPTDLVPA